MMSCLSVILFWLLSWTVVAGCTVGDDISENGNLAVVYGSVVDAVSGAPVANASVRLHEGSSGLGSLGGIVGSTVTGSDGYFSFTDIVLEPGILGHSVVVSCAGYKSGYADVRLTAGRNTEVQVLIEPES